MTSINNSKVLISGIVAGVVMSISEFILNDVVLAEQNQAAFEALNVPEPGGGTIALFVGMTFVVAILTMWLYAVLRDRSGVGPKTAVCAAVFVWIL